MLLPSATLELVVAARPLRLGNRTGGKLVKALPYELRTSKTEMNPTAFPAAFRHGRDPRQDLHLGGVSKALALRTEGRQQPWHHHRSCSGQRIKDEKIWMRFGRLLNLLMEAFDTLMKNLNQLHQHLHRSHL